MSSKWGWERSTQPHITSRDRGYNISRAPTGTVSTLKGGGKILNKNPKKQNMCQKILRWNSWRIAQEWKTFVKRMWFVKSVVFSLNHVLIYLFQNFKTSAHHTQRQDINIFQPWQAPAKLQPAEAFVPSPLFSLLVLHTPTSTTYPENTRRHPL